MNRFSFSSNLRKEILKRDNFTCQKCGFKNQEGKDLEIHHKKMRVDGGVEDTSNLITLCSICHHYAPEEENQFKIYLEEKINGEILNTFRKSERSVSNRTKKGMISLFSKGNLITRAPLGYKVVNKELIPSENSYIIQEIYNSFITLDTSLTQLAKKYNLSVNGLKKVLTNETYLGKIKFAGETVQGKHTPLISYDLFEKVQNKIKELGLSK